MHIHKALPISQTPTSTGAPFDVGERVGCRSLSLAGGTGTVEHCDDRLVWVHLDSGATRPFLPAALTRVPS